MKKWILSGVALVAAVAAVFFVATGFSSSQDGSPDSQNTQDLVDRLKSGTEDEKFSAAQELAAQGSEAFPTLAKLLTDSDGEVRADAAFALTESRALRQDENFSLVKDSLLKLLQGDDNWRARANSAFALGKVADLSPEVPPALINALGDPDEPVAAAAASGMISWSSEASLEEMRPAVWPLIIRSQSGPRDLRVEATGALGLIGEKAYREKDEKTVDRIVSALQGQLQDSNRHVRREATRQLRSFKSRAGQIAPGVARLLFSDVDERNREYARRTLENMGPAVAPAVLPGLTHTSAEVRTESMKVLEEVAEKFSHDAFAQERDGRQGEPGKSSAVGGRNLSAYESFQFIRPAFYYRLADSEPKVRVLAAKGLGHIGSARAMVQARSKSEERVEPVAAEIGTWLAPLLKDPETSVRKAAADAIGGLGPSAQSVMGELRAASKDSNSGVRRAVADALGKMQMYDIATGGSGSAEGMEVLLSQLEDSDENVQVKAIRSLGVMREKAAPAVPALGKKLQGGKKVREAAALALAMIGSPARPAMLEALQDSNLEIRGAGLIILSLQKERLPEDVPLLVEIIKDARPENQRNRLHAVSVLVNYGADAKAALPALEEIKKGNPMLGMLIQQAIDKIQKAQ